MDNLDQWYYLDGSETRGPVPAAQIAHLIRTGSLSPTTQVAQAGWQTWSPASVALSNLLGGGPQGPAAVDAPTYAIKVQCVSGPDAGKAYMISAPEVSLGRVSGIGQQDPAVADNHVVLSWQNNVLFFRTFAGSKLRVAGAEVTQGTLSNGQQFQMGNSTWQVGSAPVELTNLLSSLGSRLNQLTSTEKLEGFSLGEFFSEVFKARKEGELDEYFAMGTLKTTPPLEEVQTGWPKPWFFMRVLLVLGGTYFIYYQVINFFGMGAILDLGTIAVVGSMVVPLTMVFLFWELNTPRNISLAMVLIMFWLGGAASDFLAFIGFDVGNLAWLKASKAGLIEETGKLLAVVLVARNTKYKYMLNGLVFGACVGAGFAAFETAGYGLVKGFLAVFMDTKSAAKGMNALISIVHSRSYDAPITHVAWTAISACALWRVKGDRKFKFNMLLDPTFLRTYVVSVGCHMIWNSPFFEFDGLLGYLKPIVLGVIAWYVIFGLTQQGLRQVRDMQRTQTATEFKRTQEILTTSGRFRAQKPA